MKYPQFLLTSRGFFFSCYRLFLILFRFGVTSKKIAKKLYYMIEISSKYGATISFNITSSVLDRHPKLIKDLNEKGAEFNSHGYIHTNYANLSLNDQIKDLKKSIKVFARHQIPLYGFRAPYLSINEDTFIAVKECGFRWNSSEVINWDVLNALEFNKTQWLNYQKILKFLYKPKNADNYNSLPKFNNNILEIPVSVPDDEILVDRLGIRNSIKLCAIWQKIFELTQRRGELFTIQLHHERINYFKDALESLLNQASDEKSNTWMASLNEISEWWEERSKFKFKVIHQNDTRYHVICDCSKRATVLVKNFSCNLSQNRFFDDYSIINDHNFTLESSVKPCVGVSPNASTGILEFLKDEGYASEANRGKDQYALYLNDNYTSFSRENEIDIVNRINNTPHPLLRFWRWPLKKISALSVTGDIDAITLLDFVRRAREF